MDRRGATRLPPEVNRVLYVRNLPFKTEEMLSTEEIYDIFGKIRIGNKPDTRGTAFVVYEDIYDAKNAVDHLSGFNVCGRYLIVLYYQPGKMANRGAVSNDRKKEELEALKRRMAAGV